MRWIEDFIDFYTRPNEINSLETKRIFEKKPNFEWVKKEERYEQKFYNGIYIPLEKDCFLIDGWVAFEYAQAEKEAPLLQKSILDESIPLYLRDLIEGVNCSFFMGGRVQDAVLLGMIKYSSALPELIEAASHDLNYEMRAASVESVGYIGKEAWNYAKDICGILLKEKSSFVKTNAVESIRNIKNSIVFNCLLDILEETEFFIREYELQGYPFNIKDREKQIEMDYTCQLLEECLRTITEFNPKIGREKISKGLNSTSAMIYHWTKRAAFFVEDKINLIKPDKIIIS
ncbi:MAG: HEAT repeat domain-containing protein [Nanoarchaeota archaeon]